MKTEREGIAKTREDENGENSNKVFKKNSLITETWFIRDSVIPVGKASTSKLRDHVHRDEIDLHPRALLLDSSSPTCFSSRLP